jgi:dermatan/chondrotin sulfate uronyl 2-O-sulfotransferase UST
MKNEKALKQAKANVDRYFKVVGVLENLNETLAVLEKRIPRYFDGLQDMYFNELMSKENGI